MTNKKYAQHLLSYAAYLYRPADLLQIDEAVTFAEMSLLPTHSDVRAVSNGESGLDLGIQFSPNIHLNLAVMSSFTPTITNGLMMLEMLRRGALGIIHRAQTVEQEVENFKMAKDAGFPFAPCCVGVRRKKPFDEGKRAAALVDAGCTMLAIIVTNADNILVYEMIDFVTKEFPHVEIIVGNTIDPVSVVDLTERSKRIVAIHIGIGPGSICITPKVVGIGGSQLAMLALCGEICRRCNVTMVADGGIPHDCPGDIIKAIAAGQGARVCVMMGGFFAATNETPGEEKDGFKIYEGMAAINAQMWMQEHNDDFDASSLFAEGESFKLPAQGPVAHKLAIITQAMTRGMSSINAHKQSEIAANAIFVRRSEYGVLESGAHAGHRSGAIRIETGLK